jgi:D-alanyl-D-alanine carboxypeptidase (penicillin-binding protein 5/6)
VRVPAAAVVAGAVLALAALMPASAVALAPPALSVRAAVLVEEGTGQQLYGVAPNAELPIASTTKLMTALVTLEHVRHLDTVFTAPDWYASSADSQIGLAPGDRMTVHDLMLALMLPSADDAAEDLAYNVGDGSVARFVGMMNADARALGLRHTHYSTPIGLDTPGNYSSASDLVKLAAFELGHNRFLARIAAEPSAHLDTGPVRYVVNRNDLVGHDSIFGVKTGHTSDAGYVLVAAARRNGMTLYSAVLGTDSEDSRDANTLSLLNWGFDNFHMQTLLHAGAVLAHVTVKGRSGLRVGLIARTGYQDVLQNGTDVSIKVAAPHELTGPLPRHKVFGYATIRADGRTLTKVELMLASRVPAPSRPLLSRLITGPFTLLLVLVLLGLAAGLILRRRGHSRTRGQVLSR